MSDSGTKEDDHIGRLVRGYKFLAVFSLLLCLGAALLVGMMVRHHQAALTLSAAREAAQARALEFYARQYVRDGNPAYRESLRDAIAQFRAVHDYLAGGGADSALAVMPESARRVYFHDPYNIDTLAHDYLDHAEALMQVPDKQVSKSNPHYIFLATKAAALQRGLDSAVETLDFEDRHETERLEYMILFTLLLIPATLIGQAFLVMQPLVRQARRDLPDYRDMSLVDPLTGLDNLVSIMRKGGKHAHASVRHNRPMCLCVINIDNFGAICEAYGQAAGNAVLKSAADLMLRAIRAEDELARIGEDEFALLLPFTRLEQGHHQADRLRLLVEQTALACAAQPDLHITISAGIAEIDPGLPEFDMMLSAARDALAAARAEGPNRVAAAERKVYNIKLVPAVERLN
jgi:diguanylate cyclase (GGDEF)-like protein